MYSLINSRIESVFNAWNIGIYKYQSYGNIWYKIRLHIVQVIYQITSCYRLNLLNNKRICDNITININMMKYLNKFIILQLMSILQSLIFGLILLQTSYIPRNVTQYK